MFRIEINNERDLHSFLSLNDGEYIDVFLKDGSSTLVANNKELFAMITLETIAIDEPSDISVRFPRKLLDDLLVEGHILANVTETKVELRFFEKFENTLELACAVDFPRQETWAASYTEKLQLITALDKTNEIALPELSNLIKVGNVFKSFITCSNGIACTNISNNCKVFKRLNSLINFSASASALSVIQKVSNILYVYKNYVWAQRGALFVICTMVRDNSCDSYKIIQEEKSSFKAKVDLRYLQKFINKVKTDEDLITLDLDKQQSEMNVSSKHFIIPIMVKNLQKALQDKPSTFAISREVLDIITRLGCNKPIDVSNKRTFVQLDMDETMLVFRS